jgi:hypothetical protein
MRLTVLGSTVFAGKFMTAGGLGVRHGLQRAQQSGILPQPVKPGLKASSGPLDVLTEVEGDLLFLFCPSDLTGP